jgi:hypothetical protein
VNPRTFVFLVGASALAIGCIYWIFDKPPRSSDSTLILSDLPKVEAQKFNVDSPAGPDTPVNSEAATEVPLWMLLRDGDSWELLAEHWPKANKGAADSQYIVHTIMNMCALYRERFKGKHLADVQAAFAHVDDQQLFLLNERIWDRCGKIYSSWDQYPGWQAMLESAANNGQPIAMVSVGGSLTSNPETFEEGIRMIESALLTKNASAVASMSAIYARNYAERTSTEAWVLAACKMGLDCSVPIKGCEYVACGRESVQETLILELGDGGFYIAQQKAEEIYAAIESGRIQDLDIVSDLQ